MKKLFSIILVLSLLTLTSCGTPVSEKALPESEQTESYVEPETLEFSGLDDPNLIPYFDDMVYTNLIEDINSDDYFIENVESTYISKEFIEEKLYNSQENIYFGFNLQDLENQFEGEKYIFSLGENNETVVKPFKAYDDSFEKNIIKNVAIGTGVILTCVTISVVTGGTGAAAISVIFASSAKAAATFAVSGSLISGVSAGIITGIQTKDFDKAITTAATKASEGFKWGAISGALAGGLKEAMVLKGATLNGLSMNEAAAIQKESGYPIEVIKQFKSVDEYNVYKNAGLTTDMVSGKLALVRDIDLDYVSDLGGRKLTNLQRMQEGYAPVDPETGLSYQLHHINQDPNGTLAILKQSEHQGNSAILNIFGKESEIDRAAFKPIKEAFWKSFASRFAV